MSTKETFLQIINDREYIQSLPLKERNKISAYRSAYYNGKLKLKGIHRFLTGHGYEIKQEIQWKKAA